MTRATGEPGRLEDEALAATGVSMADLERLEKLRLESMEGKRRPLRVPIAYPDVEGGMDEHGGYIKVRFELPRGAFAATKRRLRGKTIAHIEATLEQDMKEIAGLGSSSS